ncbi:MAG: hypothetical protein FJX74_06995 [Armatimonadetes bacterium]|nr:hypothetical protein [Armatimonadota bacterium]
MANTPLLVIGLGGTGTNIARNLREILEWRYENPEELPIRFLCFDTHAASLQRSGMPGTALSVPSQTIKLMRDEPHKFDDPIALTEWVHMATLNTATAQGFDEGTGNVRMFGRLAFLAASEWNQVCLQLHDAINELLSMDRADWEKPPRIYVLASASGGTGSGTFIDMGYLLQKMMRERFGGPTRCPTVGVLCLPTVNVANPAWRRNAAAMLSELDCCIDPSVTTHIRYAGTVHIDHRDERTNERPYTYISLVAPSWGGQAMPRGIAELEWRLAHYISEDFHAHLVDVFGARRDLAKHFAQKDSQERYYGFSTIGLSTIEFPADVCHRACVYKTVGLFADEVLHRWVPENGTSKDDRGKLFRQLGLVHSLSDAETGSASDPLWALLTEPEPNQMHPREALERLIEDQTSRGRGMAALADLQIQIDAHFKEVPSVPSEADSRLFRAVVERNQPQLEVDETQPRLLAHALAQIAVTPGCGPAYAQRLVDDLQKAITAEVAAIGRALEDGKVDWEGVVGAEEERCRHIAEDWLLWPVRGWAMKRALARVRAAVYHYANCRAENLVLPIKRRFYVKLLERVLPTMKRRLGTLQMYLQDWREHAVGNDGLLEQAMKLAGAGNILFDEGVVDTKIALLFHKADQPDRRRQALAALTDETTLAELVGTLSYPDWDSGSRAFDEDVPRDQDGNADLRLLAPIERKLKDRFRPANLPDGRPLIYGEDVIELFNLRAQAKPGGPAGEIREAVVRSQEYLDLNTSEPVYQAFEPRLERTPPYRWWALHYAADPNTPDGQRHATFRSLITTQAEQVASQLGIALGADKIQHKPIGDRYRVLLLRDRTGFPSRIIRGYDPADRQELTSHAFHSTRADWFFPVDPEVFARCRKLVVGCVVTRVLEGKGQQFTYEIPVPIGNPAQTVELPSAFVDAVRVLCGESTWADALSSEVTDRRDHGQGPELEAFAQQVAETLKVRDPDAETLAILLGLQGLSDSEAWECIRGFCEEFGLHIPKPPLPGWVEWREVGEALTAHPDMKAQQSNWYCKRKVCGKPYFADRDAGMDLPVACPACGGRTAN